MQVHNMASPVDYRKLAHHSKGTYFKAIQGFSSLRDRLEWQ